MLSVNGKRYPLRIYKTLATATPNDPYATQWWTNATALPQAWQYESSGYVPTVAIIDTGFALQHEEFVDRWYRNAAETGSTAQEAPSDLDCSDQGLALDMACNNIDDDFDGTVDNETGPTAIENPSWLNCTDSGLPLDKSCNLIDDDGNGLADDVTGWDFSTFDRSVQAGEMSPNGDRTTHGTMVAGIMGATGNNGKGLAGVSWNSRILPIQAIDDDGYGDTLTVARSIYYAADQGADIINLSLGTSFEDPYLREAIAYALGKGSLVVAASGNDGCDCILYPARYDEVLAVGASNSAGSPSSFSSYGGSLDILAPGEDMTTSTWTSSNPNAAYVAGAAGTSFAAPYVSGLLATARSHTPAASWGELVAALLETSDHRGLTPANPRSSTAGHGYAKADALLARLSTPATPGTRYYFAALSAPDTLGSGRGHQCESGGFPTAPLYEMKRANAVRHTVSPLTAYTSAQSGWTTRQVAYVCLGLPHDTPSTVRNINLLSEIHNLTTVKPY